MSGHDQPIHMPPPSLSPFIIGVGVTFISFGVLWSVILIGIGVLLLLVGLATWLIDDARAYTQASDDGGHGGAHH
jgi:1,4-dihydroxy-2-naphthoate octaprenyltransferase